MGLSTRARRSRSRLREVPNPKRSILKVRRSHATPHPHLLTCARPPSPSASAAGASVNVRYAELTMDNVALDMQHLDSDTAAADAEAWAQEILDVSAPVSLVPNPKRLTERSLAQHWGETEEDIANRFRGRIAMNQVHSLKQYNELDLAVSRWHVNSARLLVRTGAHFQGVVDGWPERLLYRLLLMGDGVGVEIMLREVSTGLTEASPCRAPLIPLH